MNWNDLTKHEQSLQLVRALWGLAAADGELAEDERMFIRTVGRQHGLTQADVDNALDPNTPGDPIFPKAEPERMEVLYYLVFLMNSDGKINPEEEASMHHFGLKLGMRAELIDNFIILANRFKGGNIPVHEMIAGIRTFLN